MHSPYELTLLVVDDDSEIRHLLSAYLKKNGYRCHTAADGVEMFTVLRNHVIDLIILDLMLPGEDGLSLGARLRQNSQIPVIMLTARGEDTDRIIGREMGADDYLPKPFNPRELEARIKAVMRRSGDRHVVQMEESSYEFGDWRLDTRSRQLTGNDGTIHPLSAAEYELLVVFIERAGRVLSRDQLLDFTKGREALPFDRSIDMQVSRLRKRLGRTEELPEYIKTIRGQGYLFVPKVRR